MVKRCIWFRRQGEPVSRCVICGQTRTPHAGPCPGPPAEPGVTTAVAAAAPAPTVQGKLL